jgi:hypothetical protein
MNFQNQIPPTNNSLIPEPVANIGNAVENSLNNISQTFKSSINDFSQQINMNLGASQQFLESNTIIAKFAFLILVVIVFIFLINLGIMLLSKWHEPTENPYLIDGLINGSYSTVIRQNPNDTKSILVKRSNNQETGLEFTWSVWLYINEIDTSALNSAKFFHIFNKGNNEYDTTTGKATINNCPGLYLKPDTTNNTAKLHLVLNTTSSTPGTVGEETIDITDIPIKKWINVIIRCKNTIIDVYVNGVIAQRTNLSGAPVQNFNDVYVCHNNGFDGFLSNLLYYSKAIDIFNINKINSQGPSLETPTTPAAEYNKLPKNYKYLSNNWYSTKMN